MKDRIRKTAEWLAEKLWFLRLDEDLDGEEEIEIRERELSSDGDADSPERDLREKIARSRRWKLIRRVTLGALIIGIAGAFFLYNNIHTFEDYVILSSIENEVPQGTRYEPVGRNLYRYNTDGISCITRKNEVKWSITYNMQAPIADVCGSTMAVAEQQGNQIYVVNKDGLVGNFETLLPILRVRVSNQGLVAAVLQEDDVTWVNLYKADGSSVASDKTTIEDSGYPLDIDISPDGQKLVVSYLKVKDGIVTSDVVFYHFGSAGKSEDNYVVGEESLPETVVPEVYFISNTRAVAVSDSGYTVFRGGNAPKKAVSVQVDEEILSCFHDESRIGFLFRSSEEDSNYRMELYNYSGRRRATAGIDAEFDEIRVQNGQILMYDDGHCDVFNASGRKHFSSAYEKEIEEIFYFSEFRRYLIITQDSIDKIRIR